jgi:xanthine dehydrogenase YagS FAD-binding subunit
LLYELPDFEHVSVKSIEEAISALRENGEDARIIAGGTDLLALMKDRARGPKLSIPKVLVNIKPIAELRQITFDKASGLRVGATTRIRELVDSEPVKGRFSILCQAGRTIATTQVRNMGTVGGNLCQRPRCLYFRHPDFVCYKKGGSKCYALLGQHKYDHAIMKYGKCAAIHPSDLAPCLLALGGEAILSGGSSEEIRLPLEEFFVAGNETREVALRPDELLLGVHVPCPNEGTYQVFLKSRIRHATDFALASVAIVMRLHHGFCEHPRIVLGGIAPFPYRAVEAEGRLAGKKMDGEVISEVSEASVPECHPLAMNAYKRDLAKALVGRALTSILRESQN